MRRPALGIAVGLIVGLLLGAEVGGGVALAAALGVGALLWALRRRLPAGLSWPIAFCVFGAALGAGRGAWARRPLPAGHVGHRVGAESALVRVEGVIADEPVLREVRSPRLRWISFPLRITRFADGRSAAWEPAAGPVRVLLNPTDTTPALRYGDRVRFTGDLERPRGATNPGGFDLRGFYARQGVLASLSVRRSDEVMVLERETGSPIWAAVYRLRAWMAGVLGRFAGPKAEQVGRAIALGDRYAMRDPDLRAFERTGTYHLLAISGLHTAIVAGTALLLLRLLRVPGAPSALLVILLTWGYGALAGLRPSVVRAATMITVYLAAWVVRRESDGLNALGVAAVAILLWRPGELQGVGFQLSFLAVFGLIVVAGPVVTWWTAWARPQRAASRWRRGGLALARAAVGLLVASTVAWAVTAPLVLYHFHIVTPVSVLVNLVATPLLWAGLVGAFAVVLLGGAWAPLGLLAAPLADGAASALLGTVHAASRFPFAYRYLPSPDTPAVLAAYLLLGLGAWALLRARGPRRLLAPATLALACVALVPPAPAVVGEGAVRLTVLDVSHGQAAFAETAGGVSLFDCGSSRLKPGERFVAPALWARRHRRIERVFLSHADRDHVGGMLALAARFPIGAVHVRRSFLSAPRGRRLVDALGRFGVRVAFVEPGDVFDLGGGVTARVVPTAAGRGADGEDENDASLAVRIEAPGGRVLLPGDVQERGSKALLDRPDLAAADVVIVPHHGARNRESERLAASVGASLAVVSNRPRLSHAKTLAAFEAAGSLVLETCREGAVVCELLPGRPLRWFGFNGRSGLLRRPARLPAAAPFTPAPASPSGTGVPPVGARPSSGERTLRPARPD